MVRKRMAIIARVFGREPLTIGKLKRRLPSVTQDEAKELCAAGILTCDGDEYSITSAGMELAEEDKMSDNNRTIKRGLSTLIIVAVAYIISYIMFARDVP
ncbi:MAG: hypothetical protein LUF25_06150 [Phascolarctobacterium sp.]|nr:hypothetical protein [Phascolarctobacterium sp.]